MPYLLGVCIRIMRTGTERKQLRACTASSSSAGSHGAICIWFPSKIGVPSWTPFGPVNCFLPFEEQILKFSLLLLRKSVSQVKQKTLKGGQMDIRDDTYSISPFQFFLLLPQ